MNAHRHHPGENKLLNTKGSRKSAEESADFSIGMLLYHWYIGQLFLRADPPSIKDMRERADHVVGRFLEASRKPA